MVKLNMKSVKFSVQNTTYSIGLHVNCLLHLLDQLCVTK